MIQVTHYVVNRIDELFDYYVEKERFKAADNLLQAVRAARYEISRDPDTFRKYPSNYRSMAELGYRWRQFHAYWFGWSMEAGQPLVSNLFYETNGMPEGVQFGGSGIDWTD